MDYSKYYKKVKIEREHNYDSMEASKVDRYIFILLLAALLVIPIFIKLHVSDFISPMFTVVESGAKSDIFSYYKFVFLIIITILISVLYVYKVTFLNHKIQQSYINFYLGIFAIFIILSMIFSPYKSVSLIGMYNRHEGTLTLICYLVLFFAASNIKYSIKQINYLFYALYPFVIINMLLGLAVFNGKNPLDISWIKKLVLSNAKVEVVEGSTLWATLSNPNFISGIGAVLTVLFLTWAIFDKNKLRSGINVIIAFLSFVIVLTSFSTSGFLTAIVLFPIILILILLNDQKIKSLVVLLAFIVLVTSIYIPLANKNPRVWDESIGFILKENPFKKEESALGDNNKLIFETGIRDIFLPSKAFAEGNEKESIKFEIPTLPESGISAGTGRMYIWEKTFETAMKRPIFGYGLDTFTFVFPQNDIDKIAGLGTYNITVDKPHNMYLGLLMGSGTIVLLTFILIMLSVFYKAVRTMWNCRQEYQSDLTVPLTIFTASVAYLIQGMFNDSVVGSAVIFWVLLGVLVSILNKDQVTE